MRRDIEAVIGVSEHVKLRGQAAARSCWYSAIVGDAQHES
jgi:hypothetical protein